LCEVEVRPLPEELHFHKNQNRVDLTSIMVCASVLDAPPAAEKTRGEEIYE
jgi:hypothetical protein